MRHLNTIAVALCVVFALAYVVSGGEGGYQFFIVAMAIAVTAALASVIYKIIEYVSDKTLSSKEFFVHLIIRCMVLFFLSGTLLTFIALHTISVNEGYYFSNAEMVIRSMLYSIDLFILDLESSIIDRLDSFPHLKAMIVNQAFLSFICTIGFVISLVFSRVNEHIRLYGRKFVPKKRNHLYLFFGCNKPSLLLAADIRKRDDKSTVIFVCETSDSEDDEGDIWGNLINAISPKNYSIPQIKALGAVAAFPIKPLVQIPKDQLENLDSDIFAIVGLKRIRYLIRQLKKVKGELHLLFLSENEKDNMKGMSIIARDKTVNELGASDVPVTIYGKVRDTNETRVFKELGSKENIRVEFTDRSKLAVELLKSTPEDQPVTVATTSKENPVTLDRPLESLIVGDGELGRRCFEFIYEFGVFLDKRSSSRKIIPAFPEITITGEGAEELKGRLMVAMPGIDFEEGSIHFFPLAVSSPDFYRQVLPPERCASINYIVLTDGDDDSRLSRAIEIFHHIRRYRKDMSGLKIMVYCSDDDDFEMMRHVVGHFNRSCREEGAQGDVVRLFGTDRELFTYDIVIRSELINRGKVFMEHYGRMRGENLTWEGRRKKIMKSATSDSSRQQSNIYHLRKLLRQETQDLENASHAATKIYMLKKYFGKDYDWEGFMNRFFDADGNSTLTGEKESLHYPGLLDEENRTILNLAVLEHLRWNASHLLLGYIYTDTGASDERYMQHNCITTWEDLDKESEKASSPSWTADYKSYDYGVVETTLSLWRKNIPRNL